MNVFRIINLECSNSARQWEGMPQIIYFMASVESTVFMNCDLHENPMAELEMKSHGKGLSLEESMRQAIENLLNHNYQKTFSMSASKCSCDRSKKKMVFDFSGLSGEWRTLFEEIFKDAKWNPEMKYITASQKTISNKI